MRNKLSFILLIVSLSLTQTLFAQVNFFTNDETDSLSTDFYQRNCKMTVLAVANVPSLQFGGSLFIHNDEDKISYFLDAKSNFGRRYVIDGVECNGEGTRQKEVSFVENSFNVGFGRGVKRNLLVYGGIGFIVKETKYDNEIENNYRYTVPNHDIWFNLVGGVVYVLKNNMSALVGLDIYDRSLTLGVGYTW